MKQMGSGNSGGARVCGHGCGGNGDDAVAPASGPQGGDLRRIDIDISKADRPLNRSFNFSVGEDYAGTMIRPDALGHLKIAVGELGFRYVRFHAIFHDALGTVRVMDGKTVYDWTRIDQLYDSFFAMGIKPFVELGFTSEAMAT